MSEWKELKIDDLPSDILKDGKYELKYGDDMSCGGNLEPRITLDRLGQIVEAYGSGKNKQLNEYIYFRKRQPKAPSHEEIMTKWWKFSGDWLRVVCYYPCTKTYLLVNSVSSMIYGVDDFTGRESADIPPEE